MQLAGEFLAIGAAFAKLSEADGGADGFFAEQIDDVRNEGDVLPIANFFADVAVVDLILNKPGEKRMGLAGGGFEQGGFEGQNGLAVGTGAFGKQNDERALIERGLDFIGGLSDERAASAIDEKCAAHSGKGAKDGPAADFAFGDEDGGRDRRNDQDVHIAQVIGNEQAFGRDGSGGGDLGFENAEDAAGAVLQPERAFAGRTIFGEAANAGEIYGGNGQLAGEPKQPNENAQRMPQQAFHASI